MFARNLPRPTIGELNSGSQPRMASSPESRRGTPPVLPGSGRKTRANVDCCCALGANLSRRLQDLSSGARLCSSSRASQAAAINNSNNNNNNRPSRLQIAPENRNDCGRSEEEPLKFATRIEVQFRLAQVERTPFISRVILPKDLGLAATCCASALRPETGTPQASGWRRPLSLQPLTAPLAFQIDLPARIAHTKAHNQRSQPETGSAIARKQSLPSAPITNGGGAI